MAVKQKTVSSSTKIEKHKKKRKGVHSKSKSSKLKGSKNYLKVNKGQGK